MSYMNYLRNNRLIRTDMAKKELNQMTLEELRKQGKTTKVITWFLVITLLLCFCISLVQSFNENEMQRGVVLSVALLPIVFILLGGYKKIKAEIKQRGEPGQSDRQ